MDGDELTRSVFRVLETGDAELAARIFAPDYVNRAAVVSPAACQEPGPGAALATGAWLRSAYPDLAYTVATVIEHDDQVWSRVRMTGTHTGPFVRFRDGAVDQVFPPTGRPIDVDQFHALTTRDGRVVRHEAIRDDLGMIRQLGFLPPRPSAIARIARFRLSGRAARAATAATSLSDDASRRPTSSAT